MIKTDQPASRPTPVGEHYVRKLLLLSSCFGSDGMGTPLVCLSEPCACAQSLLQEISRPLEVEIKRLRELLNTIARRLQTSNRTFDQCLVDMDIACDMARSADDVAGEEIRIVPLRRS